MNKINKQRQNNNKNSSVNINIIKHYQCNNLLENKTQSKWRRQQRKVIIKNKIQEKNRKKNRQSYIQLTAQKIQKYFEMICMHTICCNHNDIRYNLIIKGLCKKQMNRIGESYENEQKMIEESQLKMNKMRKVIEIFYPHYKISPQSIFQPRYKIHSTIIYY